MLSILRNINLQGEALRENGDRNNPEATNAKKNVPTQYTIMTTGNIINLIQYLHTLTFRQYSWIRFYTYIRSHKHANRMLNN